MGTVTASARRLTDEVAISLIGTFPSKRNASVDVDVYWEGQGERLRT